MKLCKVAGGVVLSVVVFSFFCGATSGRVIYVKNGGNNAADGLSWANAKAGFQAGINAAVSGDEVWIKGGTYKPTSGTDRSVSFCMKNGVAIYGGFAGDETDFNDRDWQVNETILSGDIGTVGNSSDNSYHVFNHPVGINLTNSAVLDGFTIMASNANYPGGGGMYNNSSDATIRNCTFRNNNSGGNACIYNAASEPTLINCIFTKNSGGGIIYNSLASNVYAENCKFIGNETGKCFLNAGGSTAVFHNCTFVFNISPVICLCGDVGAVLQNEGSSNAQFYNCTLLYNSSIGGASAIINTSNCELVVANSIIMGFQDGPLVGDDPVAQILNFGGTAQVYNSDIVGGWTGAGSGNIDADPNFADMPLVYNGSPIFRDGSGLADEFGDLHLSAGSPCLDAGRNDYVPGGIVADANGDARIVDGNEDGNSVVDMGAYETAEPLERVEGVTIAPAGATFTEPVDVNLSCAMSDAEIRYTIDGNTPDEDSELYTGPVTISNSCSFATRAFKAGHNPSEIELACFYGPPADLTAARVAGNEAYFFKVYDASTHLPITSVKWGQSVYVQYIVKNVGHTRSGAFNVWFYISNDPVIGDGDDYKLAGTGVFSSVIDPNGYGTGVSPNIVIPTTLPSGYAGLSSIYLGMKIDPGNAVTESNEANNYNTGAGFDKVRIGVKLVSLSGRILRSSGTPAGGVNLTASGGAGTTTSNSNGYFTIKVPYGWTGRLTGIKSGLTISPAYRSYTNLTTSMVSQNYTAYVMPTISGYVKTSGGTALAGVTVTAVGIGATTTSSTGAYAIKVPYNWTGKLTGAKSGYTIPSRSYTGVKASQSGQNLTAYVMPTLSGRLLNINGTPMSQFAVKAGSITTNTNSQGYYSLKVPYNWSGILSVAQSSQIDFVPASRSYTNVTSSKSGQNFTGYVRPMVWGYAKTSEGTAIAGVTVTASNGGGNFVTNNEGCFIIYVPYNWTGRITPSKAGYVFSPVYKSYSALKATTSGQIFVGTH